MENEINSIEKTIAEHLVKKINIEPSNFWGLNYSLDEQNNFKFINEIDSSLIQKLINSEYNSSNIDLKKLGKSITSWCLDNIYEDVTQSQIKLQRELEHSSYGAPTGAYEIDQAYWAIFRESFNHIDFSLVAKYVLEFFSSESNK